MTYDTFNSFIKNYIENDKTGRAIMLTGDWGTGKSYYINYTLKPFLKSDNGGKHDCVIVSLYGLTNISDISKSIYLDLRTLGKSNNTRVKSTGKAVAKIVGKTILNGLVNKIGFDISSMNDNDLQKVYDSIDLGGKLIVLDDFERSGIDRIALLGYINNLCEQDNIKVLIIANESELIQTKEILSEDGNQKEVYTDETSLYLKAKEKTIGDTINFVCDYAKAIKSIIALFEDSDLSDFSECITSGEMDGIYDICHPYKNLRAFMQTCQKSSDIFGFMRKEKITINREIKAVIFYGLMGFMNVISKDKIPEFPNTQYITSDLGGSYKYPLFRFCYNYVVWKILDEDEIRNASQYYKEYVLNGEWSKNRDSDLLIIKNCHKHTEKELVGAIQNVWYKLLNNKIP
ncbi:MAG: KAP family NTPase, partial [Oscillospiraceae bacterium]|nr:KAP family NTPase [Oscillospiraceae bacterium]